MGKNKLIKIIDKAFKNVTLGEGIGLYEAEAYDDYASDKIIKKARAKDRELWKSWKDIPFDVIEVHYSALCFVDIQGMRFLLPAFMRFALERYKESDSLSIDSTIYALLSNPIFAQLDIDIFFTHEQYSTFAMFLKYMVFEAGDDFVDALCASQAYEKFWAKYDSDMA